MVSSNLVSKSASADTSRAQNVEYVPGHSPAEIQRLMLQAKLLRPVTERLLRCAGVESGMRLLDVGCGAGDVALLAAQLVGASGKVVAVDPSPEAIAVTQERARQAGLPNIETKVAALDEVTESDFDAVVGRYVLVHQIDPAAFLKKAASLLRTDGIVAFHEPNLVHKITTLPRVPEIDLAGDMIRSVVYRHLKNYDAGSRMTEHFFNAGLPSPKLFAETIVDSGEEPALYTWLAATLLLALQHIEGMGLAIDKVPRLEDLEQQLRTRLRTVHGQMEVLAQICGWVRL
ncbi:MAG TPA: class I SAM-dependent methyltransferase [Xanthobacteraceae bacterium]|nr:class I SAM-dependent methyltransferase [Xanthobacteraceae bacterium]